MPSPALILEILPPLCGRFGTQPEFGGHGPMSVKREQNEASFGRRAFIHAHVRGDLEEKILGRNVVATDSRNRFRVPDPSAAP